MSIVLAKCFIFVEFHFICIILVVINIHLSNVKRTGNGQFNRNKLGSKLLSRIKT